MDKAGKTWGETSLLFSMNNVEIHRIKGHAGGYCSKHKHQNKYNLFYVERGQIRVRVWKKDYDLVDITTLNPGETTTVKPSEYHRFEVVKDCIVFEVYYTLLDSDDIVREDVGGESNSDTISG